MAARQKHQMYISASFIGIETQKHKFLLFTVEEFIARILKFRTFL